MKRIKKIYRDVCIVKYVDMLQRKMRSKNIQNVSKQLEGGELYHCAIMQLLEY